MGNMLFSQRVGDKVSGSAEHQNEQYRIFPEHMYKVSPYTDMQFDQKLNPLPPLSCEITFLRTTLFWVDIPFPFVALHHLWMFPRDLFWHHTIYTKLGRGSRVTINIRKILNIRPYWSWDLLKKSSQLLDSSLSWIGITMVQYGDYWVSRVELLMFVTIFGVKRSNIDFYNLNSIKYELFLA